MFGGKILRDVVNRPTGGFPPIYLCDNLKNNKEPNEIMTKREYSSTNQSSKPPLLLMKDILAKRRNTNVNTSPGL